MKKILFAFTLVFFVTAEQNLTTQIQDLESKLPKILEASLGASLPAIDESDDLLKSKCIKNANNETYEAAVQAKKEFELCLKDLFNFDDIQDEIDEAKPKGDLDTVFRKYCGKSPILRECVRNFTNSMEPCLEEGERVHKSVFFDVTDSLLNFVCYKEGDRIALFIAEGGPECLASKADAMQQCVNGTRRKYENEISEDSAPSLTFNETECMDISEIQKCIVTHLEGCKEPTPANIMNSLFEFVVKRTPCKEYLYKDSSSNLQHTILSLVLPILAVIISKL